MGRAQAVAHVRKDRRGRGIAYGLLRHGGSINGEQQQRIPFMAASIRRNGEKKNYARREKKKKA